MMELLFNFIVFPGLFFLTFSGMFVSWFDRKLTARLQWRTGPSLLQPFYDLRKLFVKEAIVPAQGITWLFIAAPFLSLVAIVIIAQTILLTLADPSAGFLGDILVLFYFFMLPPLAGVLGAFASGNPLASIGASREIKMMLSYELPFAASLLVPVIKSHGISLGQIIAFQNFWGSFAGTLSGFIALLVVLLCVQAKMGLVPFDVSEAETELSGGTQIEYSGPLLALWKLGKMMLLVVGPLFIVAVFWAKGGAIALLLKYFLLLIASVLIRNTSPRLRIDQATRFFWGPVTMAGILAVGLALAGY